jgi:hypothetical protein
MESISCKEKRKATYHANGPVMLQRKTIYLGSNRPGSVFLSFCVSHIQQHAQRNLM